MKGNYTIEQLERIQQLEREWEIASVANDDGLAGGEGWESDAWDRLADFKTDLGLCLHILCRRSARPGRHTCDLHSVHGRGIE